MIRWGENFNVQTSKQGISVIGISNKLFVYWKVKCRSAYGNVLSNRNQPSNWTRKPNVRSFCGLWVRSDCQRAAEVPNGNFLVLAQIFTCFCLSCNVGGISRETLCYAECLLCGVLSRGVFLTRFLVSRKCLSIWDSQETIQERKIMPRCFSLPYTWVYSREQNDSVMRNHDNPGGLLAPFQLCWEGLSIWDLGRGKITDFFFFTLR